MRMGTVALHAVQFLYQQALSPLPTSANADKPFHIRVLTIEGLDVGDNMLCRAWLIGSKRPGSVVPKWMLEGEHDRRQQCLAHIAETTRPLGTISTDEIQAMTWEGTFFFNH